MITELDYARATCNCGIAIDVYQIVEYLRNKTNDNHKKRGAAFDPV